MESANTQEFPSSNQSLDAFRESLPNTHTGIDYYTDIPPMVHFMKLMMFWVSVPVLSEKMYCIWPSSADTIRRLSACHYMPPSSSDPI